MFKILIFLLGFFLVSYHPLGKGNISLFDAIICVYFVVALMKNYYTKIQVSFAAIGLFLAVGLLLSGLLYKPAGFWDYIVQNVLCFILVPFVSLERFSQFPYKLFLYGLIFGFLLEGGMWVIRLINFSNLEGDALKEVSDFGLRFYLDPFTPNELGYLVILSFLMSLMWGSKSIKQLSRLIYLLPVFALSKTVYIVQLFLIFRKHLLKFILLGLIVLIGLQSRLGFEDVERLEMYDRFLDYSQGWRVLFPLYRDESGIIIPPMVQSVHNSYAGFIVNNGLILTMIVLILLSLVLCLEFMRKPHSVPSLLKFLLIIGITGVFNPFLLHRQIYFVFFFTFRLIFLSDKNSVHYFK